MTSRWADALARIARARAFWPLLLVLSLLSVELLGALAASVYTYDRWDNFQFYTPIIAKAHAELLSGRLPLWNPHQHLGESFLANPQMGTFYPPYTLAYSIVDGLGLDLRWLCWWIAVPHIVIGALGYYALLRHFTVRPSLAYIAALAIGSAGYLRSGAAFWVFLAPNFAWLPVGVLAAARIVEGSRRIRHGLMLAVALVAQAAVGHPQLWVYVWLAIFACAFGYALVSNRPRRKLLHAAGRLCLHGIGAGLISTVTMLPLLLHSASTVRKTAMAFDDFVRSSVSPRGLLGLLLPVYNVRNGFIVQEACSFMLHQAAWVVPSLGIAGMLWLRAEVRRHPERQLGRVAAVFASVGLLLLAFALGRYAKVYSLTYALPLWSSFRYPHKFLIMALPCLGIAAGMGLELMAREASLTRRTRAAASATFVGLAALGFVFGFPDVSSRPFVRVGLAGAFAMIAVAPFVASAAARAMMAAGSLASAVMMVGLAQTYAPHVIDEPHVLDSARYAPSGQYRVLPVHENKERVHVVERLIYQSATLLGVDSVTGHTTSMAPEWFLQWLPSNSRGLLPLDVYRALLPSHFLRTLNVRVVVAPRGDEVIGGWLRDAGFRLEREQGVVSVYATDAALPRAYFATEVLPFTPADFERGLWLNQRDPRTAYVEGSVEPALVKARPEGGHVLDADFAASDRVVIEVDSKDGGFLVVSMSYDRSWRAQVDGADVPILRTNAMLQGLYVPGGRRQVMLRYESAPFAVGGTLAALGAAVLCASWLWPRFSVRRRRAARARR